MFGHAKIHKQGNTDCNLKMHSLRY
jgi:hypothetical protein